MKRNIQNEMKELFGNSCLCYSYAYLTQQSDDPKALTQFVLEGWRMGYIDDDGFVSNPLAYLRLLGKKPRNIEKVKINTLGELPKDNQFVVEYAYGTNKHFVVANYEKIVFDPAGESNTVKNGKPVSYRKIVY